MEATVHSIPTEPTACPVCGPAPGADVAFTANDRLHGLGGEFSYSRCKGCDLLFQNPRVRPEAAIDTYPREYNPHAQVQAAHGVKAVAKDAMRWLRGASLPRPVTRALGPSSRVLDVGCGAGDFLNDVRARFGAEVVGLDLSEASKKAAQQSFGIDVFCGTLDQAPWPPGSFDLITSWWSLEHMPNPEEGLAKMQALLKPGGQLLIAVPNSRSAVAKVFGNRWYHLDCPRHYHLWTPASLRQVAERQGLSHLSTTFDKSPWGLLGSLQYVVFGNNYEASKADRLRGNVKAALPFIPLTFALGLLRYSDTMVAVFEKPR